MSGGEASIVGGKSISITEAPWQLHLAADDGGCGASWIGGKWVLTAAHCVEGASVAGTHVFAGVTDSRREETAANRIDAARIIINPTYAQNGEADIALIELKSVPTQAKARAIALATPDHARAGLTNKGVPCMASGWGFMNTQITRTPDSLQAVTSKVYDTSRYTIRWAGNGVDSVGSCMGDSGGPLVVKDAAGAWILAGVSSTIPGLPGGGVICGNPKGPPNYARVSAFYAWIIGITGALPTGVGTSSPYQARIAFPGAGLFRLAEPQILETALYNLAGTRVSADRRHFSEGTHALPLRGPSPGRYVLHIKGSSIDVVRELGSVH